MDNLRYKTFIQRLGALIVDGIALAGFFFFIGFFVDITDWYFTGQLTGIVYRIVAHWQFGQTIGKWVLSIKVADAANENNNPALYHSFLREIVSIILLLAEFIPAAGELYLWSSLAWFVAELVCIWRNNKQRSVHDLIARTVVVDVKKYSDWERKYYFGEKQAQ